jgi:hypothetical protein
MEHQMDNFNERITRRKLRCTWMRQTEMFADLMLMPGITVEFLQSMIDLERVVVDDPDQYGDGYLYCFGGGKTYSELALARIVKLGRDSTDEPGSFVLSEERRSDDGDR